jgi:hypothetical protein
MTNELRDFYPERRKASRHRVSLFSSVSLIEPPYEIEALNTGPAVSAITENISLEGLLLVVARSNYIRRADLSEQDRLLRIVINLPLGESGVVEMVAKIRQPARVSKGTLKLGYLVGLQIHEMTAPHRALYNEYISTLP